MFPAIGSGATPAIGPGATSDVAIPAFLLARECCLRFSVFLDFFVVVGERCGQAAGLSMGWGQVADLSQGALGRRWGGGAA